jgi:hypothetical protein
VAGNRASIFEEPDELDVSGFAPKTITGTAPPREKVREVSEAAKFHSREPKPAPPQPPALVLPAREQRRYRTGRNVQFNVKASQETVDAFYSIADGQGWVLGETLEHALAALKRELTGRGNGAS